MSSPLRLLRDVDAPSRTAVVPFVSLSVRAQEHQRRLEEKLRVLERINPTSTFLVEALVDNLIRNGTQG
jgi:hypothetical protein